VRSLTLSKTGLNKLRSHQQELKVADFQDSLKSLAPGEWCRIVSGQQEWVGFINPQVDEKYTCAHILSSLREGEIIDPEAFLAEKIRKAFARRKAFKDYAISGRMIYGVSDGLAGVIVDQFVNASIIQINTAGMDRFRELISKVVYDCGGVKSYFLDNPKYREKESLPTFDSDPLPELQILENNLKYTIRPQVLQKVGFYYDHRENRLNLMNLIERMKDKPMKGLDLFCYVGAWGLSALKSGVNEMYFVDQGDFETEVLSSLEQNHCNGFGKYVRGDVFKFLDQKIIESESFNIILCDPPAFAKSSLQKMQALEGYSKLHRKVLRLASPGCLVAFSSCTHYVSHEEFQKNISESSAKENRKVQLIYSGMQGFDHPISSVSDRSNYIKSYFYIVE
jgi:23S rRNA (cytosine1962-C5)-methyltransferase